MVPPLPKQPQSMDRPRAHAGRDPDDEDHHQEATDDGAEAG